MKIQKLEPWFQRKFPTVQNEAFLVLLERLEGTPIRIQAKLDGFPLSTLTAKPNNTWSVLEHIGHLDDLEPLWFGRIGDIQQSLEVMREADLTNQKTHQANHNIRQPIDLIKAFELHRKALVLALKELTEDDLGKSSLHPRLKTPMKIVDLMYFVAEHDDHHLAACSLLLRESH